MIFQYDVNDSSSDIVSMDLHIGYGHDGFSIINKPTSVTDGPINGNFNAHPLDQNCILYKNKVIVNTSVDLTDSGNNNAVISITLKGGMKEMTYPNLMPLIKDDTTAHFTTIFYFI